MSSNLKSWVRHLRRTSRFIAAIKSLRIPTVFDGPGCRNNPAGYQVPKFLPADRIAPIRPKNYGVGAARLPWSTLTPGPIVLETDTFFK
jgi:hypothetical protein